MVKYISRKVLLSDDCTCFLRKTMHAWRAFIVRVASESAKTSFENINAPNEVS